MVYPPHCKWDRLNFFCLTEKVQSVGSPTWGARRVFGGTLLKREKRSYSGLGLPRASPYKIKTGPCMTTYVFVHGPVFIRTAQSHQLAGFPQRATCGLATREPLHIKMRWPLRRHDLCRCGLRTAGSPLLLSVLAASLCLPLVGTCWARKARASPYISK